MTKQIASYKNGNTVVTMYDDGTKIRYTFGTQKPEPEFPESIDLKITNRCDRGCRMCHEMSTPDGAHADLNHPLLRSLHAGTELAIGGGNPLEHPNLKEFLSAMRKRRVLCNLTVHQDHLFACADMLKTLMKDGLIHGLGVSVYHVTDELIARLREYPTAVVHVIAGYTPLDQIKLLADNDLNLLILGYKNFGRGTAYQNAFSEQIAAGINELREYLPQMKEKFRTVCFDNLALKQLDVKNTLFHRWPMDWEKFYMGDDGSYTMYVDLVKNKFAKSSVSPRRPINSDDIRDLFKVVKADG